MKPYIKNLGKVKPTTEGIYDPNKSYLELSIVEFNLGGYISRKCVPFGIYPTNKEYWQKLGKDNDDNFILDEEDLTYDSTDGNNFVKFKNRDTTKGKGYVILRTEKSIFEQMTQENTIYEVRYDFDLGGGTLEVPENCVLDFQGGSLTNGTIICSDTELKGNVRLDVSLDGIVANNTLYMDWFVGNDYIRNIRSLHKVLEENGEICFTNNGFYEINLSDGILVDLKSNVKINGRGCTIKIADGTNTSSYIWKTIFKAREGVENISIKNIVLDVNNQNNMFSYAPTWQKEERCSLIDTVKARGIKVMDCEIKNNYALNDLIFAYTDDVIVERCKFVNCGTIPNTSYYADHSNIYGTGSNWRITNNYIYNETRLKKGTGLDLNCKDSVISANYVEHCYAGLNLSNNGTFECENNVVSDNIFVDNHCAIYFWSRRADGVEHGASNIIVKNNLIYWKARNLQYECRGIDLFRFVVSEVKNINIIGNTIYSIVDENTDLAKSNEHAILLGANYYDIINSGTVNTTGKVYNINISNNVIHTITGYGISLQDKTSNVSIVQNTLKDCHIGTLTTASAAIELMTKYDEENPIEYVNINDNVYYNDKYNTNYGLRIEKLVRNIKILFNDFRSAKPTGMEILPNVNTDIVYPNIRPENIFVRGFLNKSEIGAFTAVKCIDGSELYDTFRGIVYKPSSSYNNGYWRSENYYKSAALPNIALPRAGSMVWSAAPEETGCIGHVVMKNAEEGNPVIRAFGRDCMCTTMGGAIRPEKHAYGYPFFDTTLNKPIWQKADGTWVDATGQTV